MDLNRYQYIEERFLPRLSTDEIKEIPKGNAVLILPIGATEQHGPHLPVYTDTLLVESVLNEAFKNLHKNANVWTLPSIPFGKSNEHMDRAGTFTFSFDTLRAILFDLGRSSKANGFRKLILLNGHGGNIDTLRLVARDIKIETGLMIFIINIGSLDIPGTIVSKEEMVMGIHGGDYETSLIMHSIPEWVRHDKLTKEVPGLEEISKHFRFQKGNFAWTMDEMSSSGILGDATLASSEKGKQLYEEHGVEAASIIEDVLNFDVSKLLKRNK